ncbi:MAG: DNA-directed RNA polymerase subunit beta, partial [Mailhella sp.]|nr:DNA-directed RNA polymerase subunit beta [Mailhella sp.]
MGQLTKQFGKIKVSIPIPHLLNLQVDSYKAFLQEGRKERLPDEGLEGVFRSVFPIEDFNRTASLEYLSYDISEPKYDQAECISKGLTYEAPIRLKVRLDIYDVDEATGNRTFRDGKEQDIYFGTLPLMTEKGTFIINGTERVIVNQLQRSPGIIFEHDGGKTHTSHKVLYSCRVIPMRGSWLDFDFDHKDILYVRIDRRRKMPATVLLKAMGMSKTDILNTFYKKEEYRLEENTVLWKIQKEMYRKEPCYTEITDKDGTVLIKQGKVMTTRDWRNLCNSGREYLEVDPASILGLFLAADLVNPTTGEIIAEAGDEINAGLIAEIHEAGIKDIQILYT